MVLDELIQTQRDACAIKLYAIRGRNICTQDDLAEYEDMRYRLGSLCEIRLMLSNKEQVSALEKSAAAMKVADTTLRKAGIGLPGLHDAVISAEKALGRYPHG